MQENADAQPVPFPACSPELCLPARTPTCLHHPPCSSIYLNEKRLVQYWQRLAPDIRAINSQLDWELEGQLGYHPLPTPQQAEAIALRGAAAAAWRAEHGFAAQGSTAYGRAVRGGMGHGGMVRRNGAAADDAQA